MAWGGTGGQVDRIQKTKKGTVQRTVEADKKKKDNAAEIAKLKKRIARGGMMMQRGQLKAQLESRIKKLEGGGKKKTTTPKKDTTPNKTTLKTPAQRYTEANKDKPIPKHRPNSKKSWLDKAWGR